MINSDLVSRPPATNLAIKSLPLLYFKRKGNSEKFPINIDYIFPLWSSLRYWFKQQQIEGPVWKVHS